MHSFPCISPPLWVNQLNPSQEDMIRVAALETLFQLPPFPLKPKSDCTNTELANWDLASQTPAFEQTPDDAASSGLHTALSAFLSNENRVNSLREVAAIYGRSVGGNQAFGAGSALARTSMPILLPYEVACNEAAAYLVSGQPNLLTHRRELSDLAKKVVRNSGFAFTAAAANTDKL